MELLLYLPMTGQPSLMNPSVSGLYKASKSMHHLRFTCEKPGSVLVRDTSDSPEREINLVKEKDWKPAVDDLPAVIPPPGLSLERRQYLFEKIREFCPPECQV